MTSKSEIANQVRSASPESIGIDEIESIFDGMIEIHQNSDDNVKSIYQDLIELLDASVVDVPNEQINWELIEHLMADYRPGDVKTIPVQYPVSNIVGRNIIRQRTWSGDPATIPTNALRYLRLVSYDIDGDYAAEEKGAYAWGWGHPKEPVKYILDMMTRGKNQIELVAYLPHLMVCDQDACTKFIVQNLLHGNLTYGEIQEYNGLDPKTEAQRKYRQMREIYGCIKDIGSDENSRGNTIENPDRPQYWHIFDFLPEFEYKQENVDRLHNAFPDPIIKDQGEMTDPYEI